MRALERTGRGPIHQDGLLRSSTAAYDGQREFADVLLKQAHGVTAIALLSHFDDLARFKFTIILTDGSDASCPGGQFITPRLRTH
ncbi:hypothetical protein CEP68_12445 [Brevundimonas vesicularis]|uniref:Uncharacterized protein n=1 Tax=Brevundimonas vesicularis TaxID=41276 RepID=A0A1Z3UAI1_BREVE|nr:hypothetical protein CEP68_12445 [Brevundimonas vesicularis]